jgi:acyl-CoA reductase-like NAD-dependent aldehyde dehydrogenase
MATTAVQEYRQYIGGDWVAADGGTYEDNDPFTGDVFATVAAGGADDARRAVEAAEAAFPAWSKTPPAERQRIFHNAADILEGRQLEVVEVLARETGCSFGYGMFQSMFVPNLFRHAAALA